MGDAGARDLTMRISVAILLFLVCFNLGTQILIVDTGIAADMNADPALGDTSGLDDAASQAEVQAGSGIGDTLFGLYNALMNTLSGLWQQIFVGEQMLKNAGFPDFWIDFIFSFMKLIVALDTIAFLRGWDLL